MLKCKCCQGSEFGLTVVETKVSGFRAVGGEVVEQIGEPEVTTETKISYCFGCNKPITDEDTYENETCPVCGKVVESLVDGRCEDCDKQVKALANMSKEELIMMMLKGNMPQVEVSKEEAKPKKKSTKAKTVKKEEPKEEVKEEPKEVTDKVVPPVEEANANLNIDTEIEEDELSFLDSTDDLSFPQADTDDDILNQIDQIADLSELNLMDEDTVQPI